MNRDEFIDKLQRTLAGGLGSYQVAENVRYYQEYIDSEVRKGKAEEEVLDMLGDPRLLAKSIIEANKRAGASEGVNQIYDEDAVEEDGNGNIYRDEEERSAGRVKRIPGWAIALIVMAAVVVVFGIAFSLLSVFWPFILVIIAVTAIAKFIGQRK